LTVAAPEHWVVRGVVVAMDKTAALLLAMVLFAPVAASSETSGAPDVVPSSSERVRENPAAQYFLVKTVVNKTIGTLDARAEPVEPDGYNLLKYCWSEANVLGDWSGRAGLTGRMVVRALETLSWQRDLARAGYAVEPTSEAIGRYEATLVATEFTNAARHHALETLAGELDSIRHASPGAARVLAVPRCPEQARSLELNYKVVPEDGRARFIPYVLHEFCRSQELDADDPVPCDYWMDAKTGGQMEFATETAYSVRWPDGTIATGHFDPDSLRINGTVTLRQPVPKAK
jgi:hypothetical protein